MAFMFEIYISFPYHANILPTSIPFSHDIVLSGFLVAATLL